MNEKNEIIDQIMIWLQSPDICEKAKELLRMALDEIQIAMKIIE